MRRCAALGLLVALAAPAPAFAHATLVRTSPSYRQRVETAPREIRLRFDQIVTALPDFKIQYVTALPGLP